MQNKFTKGILERQEREYKQQKPAAHKAEQAPSQEPAQAPQALPEQQPQAEQAQQPAPAAPAAPAPQPETPKPRAPKTQAPRKPAAGAERPPEPAEDLAAYIVRDSGRKAKNKTFYLDGAVIQAVRRAAAAQHVAESKLVNDILKKILLPEGGAGH